MTEKLICVFCKRLPPRDNGQRYPFEGHDKDHCIILKNNVCDVCHQRGHTAKYCKSGIVRCKFCKCEGHTVEDCDARKAHTCAFCDKVGHGAGFCPDFDSTVARKIQFYPNHDTNGQRFEKGNNPYRPTLIRGRGGGMVRGGRGGGGAGRGGGQMPCKYFQEGRCHKGNQCTFKH